MKKHLTALFIVLCIVSTLFANGSKESVSTAKDDKVTITFGFWGDTPEANMKMDLAKSYMAQHPNVNIEFEYSDGAGYFTKLQTWFSSGTTPDVFGIASDALYNYINDPFFENLAPYIAKDGLGESWSKSVVESVYTNKKGEVVAVPFISKVFVMVYNKDLFDKAGLAYPSSDWTVDDMLNAARAITSGDGVDKVYGLRWGVRPMEFYRNLYNNPVYTTNDNLIDAVNNEEFKAAVSLFADTIKEGLAPNETGGTISTGGFETGRFGMQLSATWDIVPIQKAGKDLHWDAVELPINSDFGERMKTTYRGNAWCINKNSKNKDVCWDFIKFMTTSVEAQKAAAAYGIPELLSYSKSDEYMNDYPYDIPYNKAAFINMLDNSVNFSNMGVYAQINDVIKEKYELVLAGKLTVDEMAAQVQKDAEDLMAMYSK